MKRLLSILVLLASIAMVTSVVVAQEEGGEAAGEEATEGTEAPAAEAPAVFNDACARCHNADGSPTRIGERFGSPHLGSAEVQGLGADGLRAFISAGENHRLSAEDAPTGADLDTVVEYVLTLSE